MSSMKSTQRFFGDCKRCSTSLNRYLGVDDFEFLRTVLMGREEAISNFIRHAYCVLENAPPTQAMTLGPFVDGLSSAYDCWVQGIEPTAGESSGEGVWRMFFREVAIMEDGFSQKAS